MAQTPSFPRVMILVLCGVPASGKTTCSNEIVNRNEKLASIIGETVKVHHICFDDIFESLQRESGDTTFSPAQWKKSRAIAKEKILNGVKQSITEFTLFLVDDNGYYRSMRKQHYHIARKCRTSFGQLLVVANHEQVYERNERREGSARVNKDVIDKMFNQIQIPDITHVSWEKNSTKLLNDGTRDNLQSRIPWNDIVNFWRSGAPPPLANITALQGKSRLENAQNVAHRADLECRKVVSSIMKRKDINKALVSKILRTEKSAFLGSIKEAKDTSFCDVQTILGEWQSAGDRDKLMDQLGQDFASHCEAIVVSCCRNSDT